MGAYYNEIEPYAAQWLRNLIKAGHIAEGDVDERSIVEVEASDLRKYDQCHFFAGIGVWSYALRAAGWADDRKVWTGSCPCQPFSGAGAKRGFADRRHLWPAWFRLIEQCKPCVVFGEQAASPDGLIWFDAVSTDMEAQDYAIGAVDLCAAGLGAPHIRQRLYFVADTTETRRSWRWGPGGTPLPAEVTAQPGRYGDAGWRAAEWIACLDGKHRAVEPGAFPLAHGASARVGRVRAYGNALAAPVAQAFVRAYMDVAAG